MSGKERIFGKPAVVRLSKMAKCDSRMTEKANKLIEDKMVEKLEKVVKAACTIADYKGTTALSLSVLRETLVLFREKLYTNIESYDDLLVCKTNEELEIVLRGKDKKGAVIFVSPGSFLKKVKQICKGKYRAGKDFMANLQYFIERDTIEKISAACEAAKVIGKRNTVSDKDIKFVWSFGCTTRPDSKFQPRDTFRKAPIKKVTKKQASKLDSDSESDSSESESSDEE
jgi:histone H3/H4